MEAIWERLNQDLKVSLKAQDKLRVLVVRSLLSDLKIREKDKREDLEECDILEVLSSSAKRRRESIEEFAKGGRKDLVEKEEKELRIIKEYLPAGLSEEELRVIVQEAVSEVKAEALRDLGKVMKILMPKVKGRADGKMVNVMVRELLTGEN